MLVTDKDKGKDERHRQLKEKMGDRYHCLPCREIENLLTPEVLKSVLAEYGETKVSTLVFSYGDYAKVPLGGFLDGLLRRKVRKGRYGDTSGTVTDKLKFCSFAIKAMPTKEDVESEAGGTSVFSFEQLSPSAQLLTKKMYEFVKTANQF